MSVPSLAFWINGVSGMFLAEVFRALSERDAQSPFLFEEDRTISYGEFRECVAYWAQVLRDKGVRPRDRVGLYIPNSIEAVIAVYAIAACGATYVPLSVEDPFHRLALTVKDADLKLTLATQTSPFPLANAECLLLNKDSGRLPSIEFSGLCDNHPLYIIYTSGSTGVPKGVVISSGCLGHFTRWICSYLDVQAQDVFLGHARLTFDLSLFHLFAPVLRGASVRLVTQPVDLAYPGASIGDRVSLAMFVPRVTGLMQQAGQLKPGLYPKLRHVIFCGERLHAYQANAWIENLPHVQIHNMYGPTETTVVCTYHSLRKGVPVEDPISIGIPIEGNTATLFDANGEIQEGEAFGELILSGPQISPWDYWRKETDRYFDHDTLKRCFRSGDAVRRMDDGLLYWEGRVDDQIKVRGFRIELTDIEASLSDPKLNESACVYDPESERLFLVFCAKPAIQSTEAERRLRELAIERLPAHMRPQKYFSLNELPRTANGKTDRRALLRRIKSLVGDEAAPPDR